MEGGWIVAFFIIGAIGLSFIFIMLSGGFYDIMYRQKEVIRNRRRWEEEEDKRDES